MSAMAPIAAESDRGLQSAKSNLPLGAVPCAIDFQSGRFRGACDTSRTDYSMPALDPDLRRTWLFGPGADTTAHGEMLESGADALIVDLEDFTPPDRRDEARRVLIPYAQACRKRPCIAAIRINHLESCGKADLAAAMAAKPDVILPDGGTRSASARAGCRDQSLGNDSRDCTRTYRDSSSMRDGVRRPGCSVYRHGKCACPLRIAWE